MPNRLVVLAFDADEDPTLATPRAIQVAHAEAQARDAQELRERKQEFARLKERLVVMARQDPQGWLAVSRGDVRKLVKQKKPRRKVPDPVLVLPKAAADVATEKDEWEEDSAFDDEDLELDEEDEEWTAGDGDSDSDKDGRASTPGPEDPRPAAAPIDMLQRLFLMQSPERVQEIKASYEKAGATQDWEDMLKTVNEAIARQAEATPAGPSTIAFPSTEPEHLKDASTPTVCPHGKNTSVDASTDHREFKCELCPQAQGPEVSGEGAGPSRTQRQAKRASPY